ncbi:MAG: ROK family protein [Bacteroidetes bacterium]|jgi:glucokinase|nr:ROK family protein [Bacteroidota bacterium]
MKPETVIGIDLGGTTVKSGLISASGDVLYENRLPTRPDEGPAVVIGQIEAGIRDIVAKKGPTSLKAVGIGAPGVVDDRGVVKAPPNLRGWDEVHLAQEVAKRFPGYRVVVENDANVAAIAEARFGAGRNHPDFLFVIWGTGVGGGIILDRKLYRGPTGGAGEIGHISIDHAGPACNCGGRGCIEAYIGQRYLSQRTADKVRDRKDSKIHQLVGGDLTKLEPAIIAQAAEQGDALAREALAEAGHLLGVAIAAVMNVMDLRVSIIGGGVSAAGDLVLKATQAGVVGQVLKPLKPGIRVIPAQLGNTAGMLGAAGLVLPN